MSYLKILIAVIFGILAVMIITAMIHLIATYTAVLLVLFVAWSLIKRSPDSSGDKDIDK